MDVASDCNKFRIAVVRYLFSLLRQSYAAFVLDLCARFPTPLHPGGNGSATEDNNAGDGGTPWRESALVLEEELKAVRAESAKLKLENLCLRAQITSEPPADAQIATPPPTSSPTPSAKKGKSKKKASGGTAGVPSTPATFANKAGSGNGSGSTFDGHAGVLEVLVSPLLSSIIAAHASARRSKKGKRSAGQPTTKESLEQVERVEDALERILAKLGVEVLLPCVQALRQLSRAHLDALFPPPPPRTQARNGQERTQAHRRTGAIMIPEDIRPRLVALVGVSLGALNQLDLVSSPRLAEKRREVKELLVLESIRAIAGLHSVPGSGSQRDSASSLTSFKATKDPQGKPRTEDTTDAHGHTESRTPDTDAAAAGCGTGRQPRKTPFVRASQRPREDRIREVADKDTFMHLCQVIHIALPLPDSLRGSDADGRAEPSGSAHGQARARERAQAAEWGGDKSRLLQEAVRTSLSSLIAKSWQRSMVEPSLTFGIDMESKLRSRAERGRQPGSEGAGCDKGVREEEEEGVSPLLRRPGEVGPVEAGMILAIAERVWLLEGLEGDEDSSSDDEGDGRMDEG